jgi:hypothetical protein
LLRNFSFAAGSAAERGKRERASSRDFIGCRERVEAGSPIVVAGNPVNPGGKGSMHAPLQDPASLVIFIRFFSTCWFISPPPL